MSKTFLALLLILFTLLGVLFFIVLYNPNQPAAIETSKKSTNQISTSDSSLSLIPNLLTLTSGENGTIDVVIQSKDNINLVQLEIAYDPYSLTDISIFPGNYFITPDIALEKIDYKNGRISYAVKCPSKQDINANNNCINPNANIVATIAFKTFGYSSQRRSVLSFLPKTLIRNLSGEVNLRETIGANITIKPAFFAPIASPSGQTVPIQP